MKIFLFLVYTSVLFSQGEFKSFIKYVNSIPDSVMKAAAVDSFITYTRSKGIPFIEADTANFIYLGNKNTVQIAGDFTGWNPSIQMIKLQRTNFFYYSQVFELNARLDYKLVTDGDWILDPLNSNQTAGGFGSNSELAMPEYIQPPEINYISSIPHGKVSNIVLTSSEVDTTYRISVYLPPGYDSLSAETYPSIYFQDGPEYLSLGYAANVLDNLIEAKKIKPAVAVFVQPNNRGVEYAGAKRNEYRLFFVNELVPYIDSIYNTSSNASDRIIIGDSWGGNISALISYNHPEVFGNCGFHSGAFWSNDYEAYKLFVNGPVKEIKIAAVWGSYEPLFTNMRNFRDSLLNKGYSIRWTELPEGHSWGLWRANIDFILEFFIPGPAVSVKDDKTGMIKNFHLYQNYPNPFNPATDIIFDLNYSSSVKIKVFDALGSYVRTLVENDYKPGRYKVSFNADELSAGVYFYRMYLDNSSETRKMVLIK